jgi:hypothetical protein
MLKKELMAYVIKFLEFTKIKLLKTLKQKKKGNLRLY